MGPLEELDIRVDVENDTISMCGNTIKLSRLRKGIHRKIEIGSSGDNPSMTLVISYLPRSPQTTSEENRGTYSDKDIRVLLAFAKKCRCQNRVMNYHSPSNNMFGYFFDAEFEVCKPARIAVIS